MEDLPTVVNSRSVYAGKIVNLRVDEITLAKGGTAMREVVDHRGAVVIAALDDDEQVWLVQQYRHPIGRFLLELPAGTLDEGEEPLAAAIRELREETGLEGKVWTNLGAFYSSPGFANERLDAYLAQGLTRVESHPDEDEELCVVSYPLRDLLAHPERTPDAKTLATLFLAARALERRLDSTGAR
jgi:ADP-ribose diphosphatase